MTLKELWELFPVVLTPHQPQWKHWADDEIELLSGLLVRYSPVITHIGSTAIPTICAKPIVDILVEIPRVCWCPKESGRPEIRILLENNGYICMSESETRMSFNKGYTPDGFADKVFHIHVRDVGDNDEICFRDYLIANPAAAREYENLKLSLLPEFRHDRDGYTAAKSDFVKRITALAKQKL